jgi:hypothetical protein
MVLKLASVLDQFREIERELPVCFHGGYIIGSQVIFLMWLPVVSVSLNDNDIMGGDEIGNIVPVVAFSLVPVVCACAAKVAL